MICGNATDMNQTLRSLHSLVLVVAAAAILRSTAAAAADKIEFPQPSQPAVVRQRVGLTDIEISYSRPNKNGREIFGGLLPYGKVWRTGANASTKIKFSGPIKLGDKAVAAGEYALYTIPTENDWTIIFSRDTKGWGAYEYKPETDAVRVTVTPTALATPVETFAIGFADLKDDSAILYLEWDKIRVAVKLTTNTVEKLGRQIEIALKNPSALEPRFYYEAAAFYYAHDKDLEQALKWIDLATEKKPTLYLFFYKKAQIEAKLGHRTEAITAAERSIELLKAAKEPDESAIRNSQMLIEGLR